MNLIESTGKRRFKINIFLIILLASFSVALAQVKVGDNPNVINANAVLDVESTDKGLLLPRVELTSTANAAPLTAHVAGMAVYNTATAGDVTPGFYFNDGAQWVAIADAAEADRQLGTHDQTLTANRSVTLGSLDLNFDANTLVIDGSANRVGIGTTTPAATLDVSGNAIIGADLGAPSGLNNRLSFRRDDGGLSGSLGYVVGSNQEFQFRNVSGGGFYSFITNNGGATSEKVRITPDGRLGIGTAGPAKALDVNGDARVRTIPPGVAADEVVTVNTAGDLRKRTAAQIVAAGGGVTSNTNIGNTNQTLTANRSVTLGNLDLNFDTNTLVIDGSADEVGIGTNDPAGKLDVFGSMVIGNVSDDNTLRFRRATGAVTGGIGYATGSNGDFEFANSSGGGVFSFVPNSTTLGGAFAFRVNNNGSTTNAGGAVINESSFDQDFRVESDGNANMLVVNAGTNRVGIGTNSPNAALDVPAGAHLSTTRIEGNTINLAQDASGDRNSILRFYSDADTADDAAINREPGVDGNLTIDNEGNGITYIRNRGSGEVRLGTNNSDDLRILNGGGIRLANLPAAADNDLPVQANANGDLRKGYRAGEIIRTTIRTSFTTTVEPGGDQVDISTTYTPVLGNSTILVTYDCDYRMGGSGTDTWYSELFVSNLTSRVTQKSQYWQNNSGGGTRSSTLLPITGARTISSTAAFTIRVRLRDNGTSSDDEVVITPNNGIMTITEIAN